MLYTETIYIDMIRYQICLENVPLTEICKGCVLHSINSLIMLFYILLHFKGYSLFIPLSLLSICLTVVDRTGGIFLSS